MAYQPQGGIPINQGFKANALKDPYWTFLNNEGFDGLKTVKALTDMYNLPLQRLREGTSLCFVSDELLIYRLVKRPSSGSTSSANWEVVDPSAAKSPLNPLGGIRPTEIAGLTTEAGSTGDLYLVEGAADAGTQVDNQPVFEDHHRL